MSIIGALIMAGGVWVILTSPDLSGGTILGAAVFLAGLWVAQGTEADRG